MVVTLSKRDHLTSSEELLGLRTFVEVDMICETFPLCAPEFGK
jgi:hypothetical protein